MLLKDWHTAKYWFLLTGKRFWCYIYESLHGISRLAKKEKHFMTSCCCLCLIDSFTWSLGNVMSSDMVSYVQHKCLGRRRRKPGLSLSKSGVICVAV